MLTIKCYCHSLHAAVEIEVPSFSGKSFIAYPSLTGAFASTTLILQLWPRSSNGLVLYNGQLGGTDFIAIELIAGFVNFVFQLGPGSLARINSSATLQLNEWHTIEAIRSGQSGQLMVDNDFPTTGAASGGSTSLQLGSSLFLGGFSESSMFSGEIGSSIGFDGCIRELRLGFGLEPVRLISDALFSQSIEECDNLPACATVECQNGGTCVGVGVNSFMCLCSPSFTGVLCEMTLCEVNNSCQNNERCYMDEEMGVAFCDCSLPYGGSVCDQRKYYVKYKHNYSQFLHVLFHDHSELTIIIQYA